MTSGSGSKPEHLFGGSTSASAECRHGPREQSLGQPATFCLWGSVKPRGSNHPRSVGLRRAANEASRVKVTWRHPSQTVLPITSYRKSRANPSRPQIIQSRTRLAQFSRRSYFSKCPSVYRRWCLEASTLLTRRTHFTIEESGEGW
jgi:hypothetical protein